MSDDNKGRWTYELPDIPQKFSYWVYWYQRKEPKCKNYYSTNIKGITPIGMKSERLKF